MPVPGHSAAGLPGDGFGIEKIKPHIAQDLAAVRPALRETAFCKELLVILPGRRILFAKSRQQRLFMEVLHIHHLVAVVHIDHCAKGITVHIKDPAVRRRMLGEVIQAAKVRTDRLAAGFVLFGQLCLGRAILLHRFHGDDFIQGKFLFAASPARVGARSGPFPGDLFQRIQVTGAEQPFNVVDRCLHWLHLPSPSL